MPKNENTGLAVMPNDITGAPEEPSLMPLEEWCAGLSSTDRRVEMVAAFHADQLARGARLATPDTYAAAYAAFVTRPA